jgi:hypothetical protein
VHWYIDIRTQSQPLVTPHGLGGDNLQLIVRTVEKRNIQMETFTVHCEAETEENWWLTWNPDDTPGLT